MQEQIGTAEVNLSEKPGEAVYEPIKEQAEQWGALGQDSLERLRLVLKNKELVVMSRAKYEELESMAKRNQN